LAGADVPAANRTKTTYQKFTSVKGLFDRLLADMLPTKTDACKGDLSCVLARIPAPDNLRKTKSQSLGDVLDPRSSWMAVANRLWRQLSKEDKEALNAKPSLDTLVGLRAYHTFVAKYKDGSKKRARPDSAKHGDDDDAAAAVAEEEAEAGAEHEAKDDVEDGDDLGVDDLGVDAAVCANGESDGGDDDLESEESS
jgi:hypothetical protein